MLGARLLLSNNQGSAIACASDLMAHGAISAARDIAIVSLRICPSWGLMTFLSQESDHKLTTVRQPISRLGYLAAERLIAMIEDRDVPEGEDRQILQTQLVVRNSTGVPREHK